MNMTTPGRCPVPAEQLPIREYEDMRASWFYSWGTRDLRGYLTPLGTIWLVSWLVTGPVASVSFSPVRLLPQFLISAAIGGLVLPTLALLQLYVGWRHVGARLGSSQVPYEESGWYDGQIWVKPQEICDRDRLIVEYQINPILRRLQKTLGAMVSLAMLGIASWQFI